MRIFLLFLILINSFIFAEDICQMKIESVEYEPETIRTGEKGFCRIKISGKKLEAEDAQSIKAKDSISFEITDIILDISSNELLVWFVPFNPLEKYLPPFKGRDFIIKNIPVNIKAYAKPADSPPNPPGAVLLPGTRLMLGFFFFLFSFVIFLLYFVKKYYYTKVKRKIHVVSNEIEIKKILFKIRNLSVKDINSDYKSFLAGLSILFRRYLEKRLDNPFMSFTSSELNQKLLLDGVLSSSEGESLKKDLFLLDKIRFSKQTKSVNKYIPGIVFTLKKTVEIIEKNFKKRNREDKKESKKHFKKSGRDFLSGEACDN